MSVVNGSDNGIKSACLTSIYHEKLADVKYIILYKICFWTNLNNEFQSANFTEKGIYECIENFEDDYKKLITSWGMSLRRVVWTADLKLLWNHDILPNHTMCSELRTAISISVPLSLFLVSFQRIFNRFAWLIFCYLSKDSEMCNWKIKKIWQVRKSVRGRIHRCVVLERLPTMLPSF